VEGLVAGAVGIGVTMVWYVKKMWSVEGGMDGAWTDLCRWVCGQLNLTR